jgi:hypothetical protein
MVKNNYAAQKKAIENAAWMNQPPHPLPVFRKGSKVNVFRGAGWSAGLVLDSSRDGCTIKIIQSGQTVRVYDARSIKPLSEK